MIAARIIFSIVLFLSVLFLPFWVSAILGLIGILAFRYYFEAVGLLLISDLMFGAPTARFYNFTFVSTLFSLALLTATELVRDKLKIL